MYPNNNDPNQQSGQPSQPEYPPQQPLPTQPQYQQPRPWQQSQPPVYQRSAAQQYEPQLPQPQVSYDQQPHHEQSSDNRKKAVLVLGVALLVALAVGAYVVFAGSDNPKNTGKLTDKPTTQSQSKSQTVAMDTLEDITLIPPADLSKYKANSLNSEATMAYATADDACALQLGVTTAEVLPGNNTDEIINNQIQKLRSQGAEVGNPTKGEALELVDASANNRKYRLPTWVFTASDDTTHARSHYSVAVLKNGSRVYITRACQDKEKAVDKNAIAPLDADAAKITVKVK